MSLGPVMLDIEGLSLTPSDEKRLQHPLVGGVILFARNYQSPQQLKALTAHIHSLRTPPLLIAVDHEGGRVQRFREGFTRIPAMRELGKLWDQHPSRAKHLAERTGWVLAAELRAHGLDFSFTPVLDMDYGASRVIGNRALHHDMRAIVDLSFALMQGMKLAGMAAVGKHFPGHGFVEADSHHEIPVDSRQFDAIAQADMQPFRQLIDDGLHAIMPAHVIYPAVDSLPAGFSQRWLQKILRERLAFQGVIFSDDLSMEAATVAGTVTQRALAALQAGCDMVLVCNRPDLADQLLRELDWKISAASLVRLAQMHGRSVHTASTLLNGKQLSMAGLREQPDYQQALQAISLIGVYEGELPLDSA